MMKRNMEVMVVLYVCVCVYVSVCTSGGCKDNSKGFLKRNQQNRDFLDVQWLLTPSFQCRSCPLGLTLGCESISHMPSGVAKLKKRKKEINRINP